MSRLDLAMVTQEASEASSLWAFGLAQQWWRAQGRAGARATELVEASFVRARLELWDVPHWVAQARGGTRVSCPSTGEPVATAFSALVEQVRRGGKAALDVCPSCGGSHAADAFVFVPPAAWGRGVLWLHDVGSFALSVSAVDKLTRTGIRWREVLVGAS